MVVVDSPHVHQPVDRLQEDAEREQAGLTAVAWRRRKPIEAAHRGRHNEQEGQHPDLAMQVVGDHLPPTFAARFG